MSTTSDNKQIIARFFEEVFNQGNMQVVDEVIHPDYKYNGHSSTREGTKKWAQEMRVSYPDLHFTIEDILAEDDKVALRWRMACTDPASKKPLYSMGTNIIVMVSGQALTNDQGGGDKPAPVK